MEKFPLRLNKFLSTSLSIARRKANQLILQNKIKLNGKKVCTLNLLIDPKKDRVEFEGKPLRFIKKKNIYMVFHKPTKVISTMLDPQGRACLGDFFRKISGVFPVGRLDWLSEGLILITNDGGFSKKVIQKNKVPKTYLLKLNRNIEETQLKLLKKGIFTKIGKVKALYVKILKKSTKKNPRKSCWIKIIISQGKNRQLHYMLEKLGFRIKVLRRTKIGSFSLKNLRKGQAQMMNSKDIQKVFKAPPEIKKQAGFS